MGIMVDWLIQLCNRGYAWLGYEKACISSDRL
jgi:hypothetical protein